MKISKRLNLIINEIKNKNIIDIGTDHAYIPIVALKKNIIFNAIASDIRKGPLEIAKKNIIDNGYEKKVKTVLSDGFENKIFNNIFTKEKITGIIAGMGGLIICRIIDCLDKKLFNMTQLILHLIGFLKQGTALLKLLGHLMKYFRPERMDCEVSQGGVY